MSSLLHPHLFKYICISVCMHSYLYVRMYALIFVYPYVCTHIYMSVRMHSYLYVRMLASVSVRQVCISVFPSICIRVQLMRAVNTKECTPYSTDATMARRIGKYINLPIHFRARKVANRMYIKGRRKESRARGADRSKRAPTTLGQQIYPINEGHRRHFLGNIMGNASHSHINDCLFQSNVACF